MGNPVRPNKKITLVGSPNVGKSAIFNCLTGNYAAVSNYPGTTVDVLRGYLNLGGESFQVIDTPGMYSLLCLSAEEMVSLSLLKNETPEVIIHVVDAKNIRRMLNLTLELKEVGLPLILNLNMMDEAEKMGIFIDIRQLSVRLGVPVVATCAVGEKGIRHLKQSIGEYLCKNSPKSKFRFDNVMFGEKFCFGTGDNSCYESSIARQRRVDEILEGIFRKSALKTPQKENLLNWLGKITRQPLGGLPVLVLVLYFGLYQFVGNFAAGYLTDFLNNTVFDKYLNPLSQMLVKSYLPGEFAQGLLVGQYGVFTLGIRYALGIILPIAGAFFLVFALLEDSGYLPRLAMLTDWLFKKIGLSGRAVIPITLGMGCGTMAVMAARTSETKRERRILVFLLALSIPCSAQLGIVMALLSHHPAMLGMWAGYVFFIFLLSGYLGNKLLPGAPASFYMEIPPLRLPLASNVFKKAYTRMFWYLMEILPIFIIISILLCFADSFGILKILITMISPFLSILGLPPESGQTFILGFFRRDYGTAGLYDLVLAGSLSGGQLLVGVSFLTLFLPCIAQLALIIKEEGKFAALIIVILILVIAFGAAFLMSLLLKFLGGSIL